MKPTVFYVEKESSSDLHAHILKHLPRMHNWFEWEGCELVYLPLHQLSSVEWDSIYDYLAYQYPILNRPEFELVLGTLRDPTHILVNRLLVDTCLQKEDGKAFLIYSANVRHLKDNPFEILAQYLPEQISAEAFFLSGFEKLWHIQSRIYRSVRTLREDPELKQTAQELIKEDEIIPILSGDLIAKLNDHQLLSDKSTMLDVVVHLLNNLNPYLKSDRTSVLQMLEAHWATYAVAKQPSRILIDKHTRIFLTDFGNLEVKMPPLPKSLYLFYLRHPKGVAFSCLSDHREELEQIYSRITNSSSPKKIHNSISDLINPLNNSINEKCSRIKEAFLTVMDISIAKHYLITGPKAEIKKISLSRDLVTYDLPALQGCRD